MKMNFLIFSFFTLLIFDLVASESDCNAQKTCGECIGYPSIRCVWCAKESMKEYRCVSENYANKTKSWCPKDVLYNPDPKKIIIKNENFTYNVDGKGDVIQFRPQIINITVRPGMPVDFEMSYRPAEDFPIDVYFLMDISYSMKTVKEELRKQASEIYQKMESLSNNAQLGIGSFVEKPGYPYFDKNKKDKEGKFDISYSFKNHLALTKDITKFKDVIDRIPFGANYDDLEAGFDALMQVMACDSEIGWRNNSRRIIVYVTDSSYHSVGDGKMIGVIKPNDMNCHVKDGLHETALSLDYPSISQINVKALEKKIKIIFVAKPEVRDAYEVLEKYILDSKYEELKTNSKTGEIIERAYKELTASVMLDTRDWPLFIDFKLSPDCKTNSQDNCKITPEKPVFTVTGTLIVTSCPKDKFLKLEIGPRAASDILTINLEIDCECECEKIKSSVSPKCNNDGFYQCGVCKCVAGRYGDDCSCVGGSDDTEADFKKCLAHPNDIKPCSGNAICRCGKCGVCAPGFSGEFCQYDNTACAHFNGVMCAGHGKCEMGKCQCEDLWAGDDCRCDLRNDNCIAPYSTEVCSGHGTCKCGECECNKIKADSNETFNGKYCDSCKECAEKRCRELEDYVYCYYMNNTCDEFSNQKSRTVVSTVNITEFQSPSPEWGGAKRCEKLLDSKEAIVFMFRNDESTGKLHILVQKELQPPNKANIIIAVISAIAAVILIGLFTVVLWKILIDLHDAREYKKFSEQAAAEGYDINENPLYDPPTTNFRNPAYENAD